MYGYCRNNQISAPNVKRESLQLSFCILRGDVVQNPPERPALHYKFCCGIAAKARKKILTKVRLFEIIVIIFGIYRAADR
jgi:hypothetical protein